MEDIDAITVKKLGVIVPVSVILLVGLLESVVSIQAGTVGVVTKFGQVTGRILNPGITILMPFVEDSTVYNTKKVTYETATQEKQKDSKADYKDYPVDTNTEDGQPVDVHYTIRFSVDPTKASWVLQNIGDENALIEKVVKTESRVWARNVPRRFKADELYSGEGSQKVQNEILDRIRDKFSENGLVLDFVGIREIIFDPQYVAAIKNKQVAAVQVETEKNNAEQEKFRKERRITAAEAQAKEQELQRLTISDQLLTKLWVEKWNGVLPGTILSSGADKFLLQLPK